MLIKTIKNIFISGFLLSILSACAVIKAPEGGPDDKTPPEVAEISPKLYTLNYSGAPIEFKFSEYVEKASVLENIRISPEFRADYSWSGKTLEIKPDEKLKPNTTYSITLDPGYKDLSGNSPTQAVSLIISTGNYLDSGKISGKAINASGYTLFAYNISNINSDTLNIKTTKADYKVKIGTSGEYQLMALPSGKYRLFLINDRNEDALYSEGAEEFAAISRDVEVIQQLEVKNIVFYKPRIIDLRPPATTDVNSIENQMIKISMNKSIDTNSLHSDAFNIIDSLSKERIKTIAAYISASDAKNIIVIPEKKLIENQFYRLEIDNSKFPVKDSSGNYMMGKVLSEPFQSSGAEQPKELKITTSIADSAKDIPLNSAIQIKFSNPIYEPAIGDIKLTQSSSKKNLTTHYKFTNNNMISIYPEARLQSNILYKLEIPVTNIRSVFNNALADTTIILNFTSEDLRLNGSVSGILRVNGSEKFEGKYLIILSTDDYKREYITSVDSVGKWIFRSLPEGEYILNVSFDENNNGKFDSGNAFPYRPAEKYYPTDRQIKVIQRWKVEDIMIDINL